MRYARFLLSTGALAFGLIVLGISFSNANTIMSSNGVVESSKKQFYVNQTILPDHVAYPVLMGLDKVKLELDTPLEQIYTQVEYGNRRLEYTYSLLEKDNNALAMSTLTKAEKYILAAGQSALDLDTPPTVKQFLIKTLVYHQEQLETLKPLFSDQDRPQLDELKHQEQLLQIQLESSLEP